MTTAEIFIRQINKAKTLASNGDFDSAFDALSVAIDFSDRTESELAAVDAAYAEIKALQA